MIFQMRQAPKFVQLTAETDENVFFTKQFIYGMDARYTTGFGFHQLAYGSKATLDSSAYVAARIAMSTQRRPDGSVQNVQPTHLIVGPSNEAAARAIVSAQFGSGGANNIWYNSVQVVVVPALG